MDRKTEVQKMDRKTEPQNMDHQTEVQKMDRKTEAWGSWNTQGVGKGGGPPPPRKGVMILCLSLGPAHVT